jgi:hypothetical protein
MGVISAMTMASTATGAASSRRVGAEKNGKPFRGATVATAFASATV